MPWASEYISGAIDGGRRKRELFKQLTISQAVDEVHRQGGICFAAHSQGKVGLLQQIFLHRGIWSIKDCETDLDAFQAYNSGYLAPGIEVKSYGSKCYSQADNSPGVTMLMVTLTATGLLRPHSCVSMRIQKGLWVAGKPDCTPESSEASIINCIRNGKTFVSTGPYISINYSSLPGSHAISSRNIDSSTESYTHML